MSANFPAITTVGTGTKTTGTATTTITVTPSISTVGGDLIISVIYFTGADATTTIDAGDGWVLLDYTYNSGSTFGLLMFGAIASRADSTGYSGFTAPSAITFTQQCHSFRIAQPYKFQLGLYSASGGFNATASSTTLTRPTIAQPYAQCIDITAGGYDNAGTTTTSGTVTGFTERFDTGQASPPHGVVLNERTISNHNINPTVSSTLGVGKTNRASTRVCIPIIANTIYTGSMQRRRAF